MAAIIELKYFNTFWLKKLKDVTDIVPESNTSITYVLISTPDSVAILA